MRIVLAAILALGVMMASGLPASANACTDAAGSTKNSALSAARSQYYADMAAATTTAEMRAASADWRDAAQAAWSDYFADLRACF